MNDHTSTPATQSRTSGWAAGLLLILLGAAFLLRNQGLFTFPFHNWWALFILVPAFAAFGQAWHSLRTENRLGRSAGGSLLGGLLLTLVCCAFLFNISWAVAGPLLIVLAGLGMLLNSALRG